jgi:hypothetical protein
MKEERRIKRRGKEEIGQGKDRGYQYEYNALMKH